MAFPESEYVFKHALTQDVAYNSVLIERRKTLHEQTGQAIEQLYKDNLEERYSDLAHHYSRSSNAEKAIEYLQKAGRQATQRVAYAETIRHLTVALDLLKTLPSSPERDQRELTFHMALGPALMNTKGYGTQEVEQTYTRALELSQQIGEPSQRFLVLRQLCLLYELRSELQKARTLAEQLFALARSLQDPTFLLQAHVAMSAILFDLGEFPASRAHLEQILALYDSAQDRSQSLLYGQDPQVYGLSYGTYPLWFLGYPDQAQRKSVEAIALARELALPFDVARALFFAAQLHLYGREARTAQAHAEEAIKIGIEHGFPHRVAISTMTYGWSLAAQGQETEGIAQLRQGLAAYQATGSELGRPTYQGLLAEAYARVGQVEDGLALLGEVLARVDKTGERYYEAELYRLKGELTLQREFNVQGSTFQGPNTQSLTPSPQSEAEACFLKAIEIAQKQQAKSLELHATVSLARLWRTQGKQHAACNMLAAVYNWFTEGFDTVDLKEAKALLEELGQTAAAP